MHRQAGANCTDAKLYFLDDFPIFFFIQMGPGPTTHPLPIFCGFFEFFKLCKAPKFHHCKSVNLLILNDQI